MSGIAALTLGMYIWLQSSSVVLNSIELLRLVAMESSVLRIRFSVLRGLISSTFGDLKHSTGSLDDHDHDTLMPRRRPLSL